MIVRYLQYSLLLHERCLYSIFNTIAALNPNCSDIDSDVHTLTLRFIWTLVGMIVSWEGKQLQDWGELGEFLSKGKFDLVGGGQGSRGQGVGEHLWDCGMGGIRVNFCPRVILTLFM